MDNRSTNGNEGNSNPQAANPPQGQVPQLDTNHLLAQLLQQMQVISQLIINQNQNVNHNQPQVQNQDPVQGRGPLSIHEPRPVEPEIRIPNEGINLIRNEGPRQDALKNNPPLDAWLNQQKPDESLSEAPFVPQNYSEHQYRGNIHETPQKDVMLERIEKLEQNLPKGKGVDLRDLSLYPEARLPIGFKMPEIDRFNGRGSPTAHLTSYMRAMQAYGCRDPELAQMFHMSLTGPAQKWFLKLKRHQVATWANIMEEFTSQYEGNEDLEVTKKQLEMTKQGPKESFSEFVARWRELASQLTEKVKEEELIGIIRHNFTPAIQAMIGITYIPHFKALLNMGAEAEQALAKKAEVESSRSSSQYTSKKANTSFIHQINHNPRGPAPPQAYQNTPPPYASGPSTIDMNWAATFYSPSINRNYHSRPPRQRRVFSALPGSLARTFEKLKGMGLIKPRDPIVVPNPPPKYGNINGYCDYHQGAGHKTEECTALRHAIQDLIDQKVISDPGSPNVTCNPFPDHMPTPGINTLNAEELKDAINV